MMVENRPLYLYLLLSPHSGRLFDYSDGTTRDPLLKCAAIVVYICMPIANYTVASSFADPDQPTHHTI